MWNDVETTIDYLHFSVVSKTVADLIVESGNTPISIGVSGSWGSGKSSMVKMIGKELMTRNENADKGTYVFLEFNAWLYQGYEDAKSALLQVVTKKLSEELAKRKPVNSESIGEKLGSLIKRVNWFQVTKMALPLFASLIPGVGAVGTIATFVNSIKGATSNPNSIAENSVAVDSAFDELAPEVKELLNDESAKATTQQIDRTRTEFEELLDELDITLVVLVDDLDRCLPETAISTLEAMRLLLFVKKTAFIIAADEQMIRNGVKAHFGDVELSDGLVTSYFDKLIQVPITVPHLGTAEVKVYIVLLFLELENRRKKIDNAVFESTKEKLTLLLSRAWDKNVTKEKIREAFDTDTLKLMEDYISASDQLAGILVTADNIKGNPRLIKRFLNALEIRKKIATLNGMTIDSNLLIKMLLFERCASMGAFDYLSKMVVESDTGKLEFIKNIEEMLELGKEYETPDSTWKSDFVKNWIMLPPKLSEYDLRPVLYLSRDRSLAIPVYDSLSLESQEILIALKNIKNGTLVKDLVERIKAVGEKDAETLLMQIFSIGRNNQWNVDTVCAALHITEAYANLGNRFASALGEIPSKSRKPPIIPLIATKVWAKELMQQWNDDSETPITVKKAIEQARKE